MIKLGFTGTSGNITVEQVNAFMDLLKQNSSDYILHHGDCVGADRYADAACDVDAKCKTIVLHPPENPSQRAFCDRARSNRVVLEEKPYLVRNHDIVNDTQEMIAMPGTEHEVIRSGTWATVRYARKNNKPVTIIYPSGRTERIYEHGIFNTL